MPKKNQTPVITHVEILSLAIAQLERRVDEWRPMVAGMEGAEALLETCCHDDLRKIEALKEMYRIETGTDY